MTDGEVTTVRAELDQVLQRTPAEIEPQQLVTVVAAEQSNRTAIAAARDDVARRIETQISRICFRRKIGGQSNDSVVEGEAGNGFAAKATGKGNIRAVTPKRGGFPQCLQALDALTRTSTEPHGARLSDERLAQLRFTGLLRAAHAQIRQRRHDGNDAEQQRKRDHQSRARRMSLAPAPGATNASHGPGDDRFVV